MENKFIQDEKYLVTILSIEGTKIDNYYVVVPGRKELGDLVSILPPTTHAVGSIEILNKTKDFKILMEELKKGQTPEDLEFGQGDGLF